MTLARGGQGVGRQGVGSFQCPSEGRGEGGGASQETATLAHPQSLACRREAWQVQGWLLHSNGSKHPTTGFLPTSPFRGEDTRAHNGSGSLIQSQRARLSPTYYTLYSLQVHI